MVSADLVGDLAAKWKGALRQRPLTESRKRCGETAVPFVALVSSVSIHKTIIKFGKAWSVSQFFVGAAQFATNTPPHGNLFKQT
jgi:hypothetical protein